MDSLNDFRAQLKLIFRMALTLEVTREMRCICGMIDAMTRDERELPEMIDEARRKRIAAGAGVEPSVVENLVCDFTKMRDKLKSMSKSLRSITE